MAQETEKREYFSIMAMQGMLANINQSFGKPDVNEESMEVALERQKKFIENVAAKSIQYADALIKELKKNNYGQVEQYYNETYKKK